MPKRLLVQTLNSEEWINVGLISDADYAASLELPEYAEMKNYPTIMEAFREKFGRPFFGPFIARYAEVDNTEATLADSKESP